MFLFLSCCINKETNETNQQISISAYVLDSSIQLYSKAEYEKALLIADSLIKKDTVLCKECIMVILNQIKLNKYKEAKESIAFCEQRQNCIDTNGYMELFKVLKSTLDYAIKYKDEEQLNIVTNLVFNLKDSMDIIDKYFDEDMSNTYTITVEE
jgi:hypothetical protein